MFNKAFRGLGKLAFLAATMALLTGVSLILFGSFLITFPVLRKSPRDRKIKATNDLVAAGMTMLAAMKKDDD